MGFFIKFLIRCRIKLSNRLGLGILLSDVGASVFHQWGNLTLFANLHKGWHLDL